MENRYQDALDKMNSYNMYPIDELREAYTELQELIDKYEKLKEGHELLVDFADDLYLSNKEDKVAADELINTLETAMAEVEWKQPLTFAAAIKEAIRYIKAVDKMAYLLTNAEKDSCYYCPLSRSGESLDEIKKKCIAKGGVICMKEDWKEWALRDE